MDRFSLSEKTKERLLPESIVHDLEILWKLTEKGKKVSTSEERTLIAFVKEEKDCQHFCYKRNKLKYTCCKNFRHTSKHLNNPMIYHCA